MVYTEQVGRFEKRVQNLLKRDCPPPHMLGEYQLNLLTHEAAASVAAHVRECPHCQAELETLVHFLEEADGPSLPDELTEVTVDWEEAQQAAAAGPVAAGVRGSVTRVRTFAVAHLWLAVTIQDAEDGRKTLLALVTRQDGQPVSYGTVWLSGEHRLIMGGRLDPRGNVEIAEIEPGEYDLGIQCDGTRVWVRGVRV